MFELSFFIDLGDIRTEIPIYLVPAHCVSDFDFKLSSNNTEIYNKVS